MCHYWDSGRPARAARGDHAWCATITTCVPLSVDPTMMSLETKSVVHCLQFSQFPASSNLLALGVRSGVAVKSCTLPVGL